MEYFFLLETGNSAGFTYDWSVVKEPSGEAIPLSKGTLYIDPLAVMYVIGTVLQYKKDLFGTILSLDNPIMYPPLVGAEKVFLSMEKYNVW